MLTHLQLKNFKAWTDTGLVDLKPVTMLLGTNSSGKTYSFATQTPLLKSIGCQWIKSGKLSIKREGKKDALIDYGTGTCDDKATLNVGTWTKEITAKKW